MSKRRPWFKFHTQDWRADPCLRMCSPAARGMWADMLSIMHEAEPYGHLLIGAKPPTEAQLSRLLSIEIDLIGPLIGELSENGVFSITEDGVIFSRRMVRDAEQSDAGREAITKRWGKPVKSRGVTSAPIRTPNRLDVEKNGADPNTKSQSTEGTCTSPTRARIAYDSSLWSGRMAEATALAGDALRGTNPASKVCTVLRGLCEPASGEPCDWDADVLPAIEVLSARMVASGRQFDTWDYVKGAVLENRDKRLAGVPPVSSTAPAALNGHHARRSQKPSMASVIKRMEAEGKLP